jgi:hypothetical protein
MGNRADFENVALPFSDNAAARMPPSFEVNAIEQLDGCPDRLNLKRVLAKIRDETAHGSIIALVTALSEGQVSSAERR